MSSSTPHYKCENIEIRYVAGSERDVYAEWKFHKKDANGKLTSSVMDFLQEFEFTWWYYASGRWFDTGEAQKKPYNKNTTRFTEQYSPPDNTRKIKFKIKPVSTTKKKDGKETHEWIGDWAEAEFVLNAKEVDVVALPTKPVLTQVISDEALKIRATWVKPNTGYFRDTYLAGWSYVFRYQKDNSFNDGDSGELDKDVLHKDYQVEPGTTAVKFKITPIPIGSYFVGGGSGWVTEELTLTPRSVDLKKYGIKKVAQTNGSYEVKWKIKDTKDDGITSFDVQWQYFRKNGSWMELNSLSVDARDYIEEDTTKKVSVKLWRTTFEVDPSASQIRARAKPVSNLDNIVYTETWSDWVYCDVVPDPKHINTRKITYLKKTKNTYVASWTIGDNGNATWKDDVASFQYEWEYGYTEEGTRYPGGNGSVPVAEGKRPDLSSEEMSWEFTFTRPENAMYLRFRAKPVPVYSNSFDGEYGEWYEEAVAIPKISLANATTPSLKITIADANTGMLRADFNRLNNSNYNVASYEYKWEYCLTTSKNTWVQGETSTVSNTTTYITYTPPDNTHIVKVNVRPVAQYDDEFEGIYVNEKDATPNIDFDFSFSDDVPRRSVTNIVTAFKENTDRTVRAQWQIGSPNKQNNPSDDISNVDSFEYVWRYRMNQGGMYRFGTSGTVDVSNYDIGSGNHKYWNCEYDYPEDAFDIVVQIKPIPTSALAFTSDFSENVPFSWTANVPHKTVLTTNISPQTDLTDRKVYISWTISNPNTVGSYEIRWAYLLNGVYWYEAITTEDTVDTKSEPFTIPENSDTVMATVRPLPRYEQGFLGDWSDYKVFSITKKTVRVSGITNSNLRRYSDDSRILIFTWNYTDYVPVSYDVQWEYLANGVWRTQNNSVDAEARLQDEYDSPDEATCVKVRVRPVFDNDPTKIVEWSSDAEYYWRLPNIEVIDLALSIQRGTTRTIVATWTLPTIPDGLDSFSYEWRYTVDGVYFSGSSGTTAANTPACTYDAPENADTAMIRVKAVPVGTSYFVSDWTDEAIIEVPKDITPETAQTPTLTMEGHTAVVRVDTYDPNTSMVQFELVEVSTERVVSEATSDVVFNTASQRLNVVAGYIYKARARGLNEDLEYGEWSQYTADIATIPNAVEDPITIEATSATSVEIQWYPPSGVATYTGNDKFTVEYTTKERYFDAAQSQVQTATSSISRIEITGLDDNDTGLWFFRIKAKNETGESEWSKIISTLIGTTPEPPTTWSSTITATVDREIYLFWIHNSEDGSKEREAELELDVNGNVSTQVITKDSEDETTSSYYIPAGTYTTGATIRWRVRTKGALEEFGEWSIKRVVDIYAPPSVSMYFESGVNNGIMSSYPLVIGLISAPAPQTPIGYSINIISNSSYEDNDEMGNVKGVLAGETIYSNFYIINDRETTITLGPGDVSFGSTMSYTIRVSVTMDSGLTAETESHFSVRFEDTDFYLNAELGFDPEVLGMRITPKCMAINDVLIDNVSLSVYRRGFDGSLTLIMDEIPNDGVTTVVDPHPALDYARYRIVARSNYTGKVDYYDLPAYPIGETSIILQWDESWTSFDTTIGDELVDRTYSGSFLKLPFNVKIADSNTIDNQLVEYIGRKHPVSYYGTQVGQKLTLNADIALTDVNKIYALRRLAVWMGDVYVREPSGSGYWAKVDVSFSQTRVEVTIPVTISVTRVEGGA